MQMTKQLKKWIGFTGCFLLLTGKSFSQISPPGEGIAHTAEWLALGMRQKLDTIKDGGWQSVSYVGMGRKSNPNNYDLMQKPAIWVFNQEFYHQFRPQWQYSMAISYRRQDEYLDAPPYKHDNPRLQQEFRLYGRLSYNIKKGRFKIVPTYRQEFRKFFTPDFKTPSESFQLRSRFRVQLVASLNEAKTQRLTIGSEQLFSISKEKSPKQWTGFTYKESRFSLYYSLSPKKLPATFSIGYMNNLVGNKRGYDVHYLAFDIVIENPF